MIYNSYGTVYIIIFKRINIIDVIKSTVLTYNINLFHTFTHCSLKNCFDFNESPIKSYSFARRLISAFFVRVPNGDDERHRDHIRENSVYI